MTAPAPPPRGKLVLREREVARLVGLSRSGLQRRIAAGEFPRPIKITSRAIGFVASEVDAWLAARIAARDGTQTTEATS